MRSRLQQSILIATLVCTVILTAVAQNATVPPDVEAFAAQYVAAFNAQDTSRLEALNVPESLALRYPGQSRCL